MRASQMFFKTIRELPGDVDAPSHRLLLRASMIQQVSSGIFSYMPLGWRALQNIRAIINEEMQAAGGQEISMPVVQPVELWEESGRINTFIPPLAQFEDRRGRQMVLAPTHEETVTAMARAVITSYRDMPSILYHIQTKFRDEIRSRGGLLRVREFEMKDAYSFDRDAEGLDGSFNLMAEAYRNIFGRCGTATVEVEADSGGIGGKESIEFVMLAEGGEDVVLQCGNAPCGYAANSEKAAFKPPAAEPEEPLPLERFETPEMNTIKKLAEFVGQPAARTAKAVFYSAGGEVVLVVVRGDLDVNDTKLRNALGVPEVRLASPEEVKRAGLTPGYTSPVGVEGIKVVIDTTVDESPNLIGGANEPGYHLRNINHGRDFKADIVADIALAEDGHCCARCGEGEFRALRGIEVGHIFKLGCIYAEKMNFNFQDSSGKLAVPFMGCYGIGLGRLLAATIEANHDENGIKFPVAIAPYKVAIVGLNLKDEPVRIQAEQLYAEMQAAGIDVLYDDRSDPTGVKLNDADLIGYPVRIVVSRRGLDAGTAEVKLRQTGATSAVGFGDLTAAVERMLGELN